MKKAGSSFVAGLVAALRWLVPAGILALAGLMGTTSWSLLVAQEPAAPATEFPYASIDIPLKLRGGDPESKKDVLELIKLKNAIFKGEKPLIGNEVPFDDYFNKLIFPKMTHRDELPLLANHRRDFFKQVAQIKDPTVHERLMQVTLKAMKVIAAGKYHPAARHNAMLIVGELDDREMVAAGENKSPPDPMRAALAHLLDEVVKGGTTDYLRVAALVGIQRHVELDQLQVQERRMPEITRNQLIDKMVLMVAAPVPSDPVLAEGRQWIRRQAMEVLGSLGHLGVDGKVFATLKNVLANAKEPVLLRAAAAGAIGRLNYPQGYKTDTKQLIVEIASIPLAAVAEEGKRLEARTLKRELILERKEGGNPINPGVRGPEIGPGILPPIGGADPNLDPREKRDLDYSKVASRRLRAIVGACYSSLAGVRNAEKGLPALLLASSDPTLTTLAKPVRELAMFLEEDTTDVYEFEEKLLQRGQNLSQALAPFVQPAKSAVPMPMPMTTTPDEPDPLGK